MQARFNGLKMLSSKILKSRSMSSGVVITATPAKVRLDENIHIEVSGLNPHQKVTLSSQLNESNKLWTSHAHYTASENGTIDTTKAVSEGGIFKGIDPMGLFWNISVADDPQARLLKRDVGAPIFTTLFVSPGHIGYQQLGAKTSVAQTTVERFYMTEAVQRIPIREGRIRGTLFIPKGPATHKYPGIIDLYGTTGGLLESRAALLASHGFAALALAYFNYDDLPEPLDPIDLEYFEEAVGWLDAHPQVVSDNLGVVGVSKGGEMALHISTITEKVKAVVAINSYFYNSTISHTYQGRKIPCIFPDLEYAKMEGDWMILEDSYDKVHNIEECYIPVEKSNSAEFLLIHGGNDRLVLPHNGLRIVKRLWEHGRDNVALHVYPGAGHLIEPRYMPVCSGNFHKVLGANLYCGGVGAQHAYAQSDSWGRILQFFTRILRLPSARI